MADHPAHPAADIFPMLPEAELRALADDIRKRGRLLHPIVLDPEGRILDGRNREAACRIAGVEPHYIEADPDDPVEFVVSLNVRRRQLSPSQAAVAAAWRGRCTRWGRASAPTSARTVPKFAPATGSPGCSARA